MPPTEDAIPLGSHTIPWPPESPRYAITVHFSRLEGRAVAVGIEIRTYRRGRDPKDLHTLPVFEDVSDTITAAGIRAIPIGQVIQEAASAKAGSLRERARKSRKAMEAMHRERQEVLETLKNQGPLSTAAIAKELGIGLQGAQSRLVDLRNKGLVSQTTISDGGSDDGLWRFAQDQDPLPPRQRPVARGGLPRVERRGRKPTTDTEKHAELEAVADVYRRAFAAGRHDPTRAVADELQMARSTAGKKVARARREGLLPPTEPRRPKA